LRVAAYIADAVGCVESEEHVVIVAGAVYNNEITRRTAVV